MFCEIRRERVNSNRTLGVRKVLKHYSSRLESDLLKLQGRPSSHRTNMPTIPSDSGTQCCDQALVSSLGKVIQLSLSPSNLGHEHSKSPSVWKSCSLLLTSSKLPRRDSHEAFEAICEVTLINVSSSIAICEIGHPLKVVLCVIDNGCRDRRVVVPLLAKGAEKWNLLISKGSDRLTAAAGQITWCLAIAATCLEFPSAAS